MGTMKARVHRVFRKVPEEDGGWSGSPLAMALWESLGTGEREAELELSPEDAAEIDRRWSEHIEKPDSVIPWDKVRRKLMDRE
jgi:putative addiction module component (TIGR02574 family)